jgi:hypothetical protein
LLEVGHGTEAAACRTDPARCERKAAEITVLMADLGAKNWQSIAPM